MSETTNLLYRSGEAAKMIGIAHSTLRLWVKEGRIKPTAVLLGGDYRWSLETINEIRKAIGLEPIEERR